MHQYTGITTHLAPMYIGTANIYKNQRNLIAGMLTGRVCAAIRLAPIQYVQCCGFFYDCSTHQNIGAWWLAAPMYWCITKSNMFAAPCLFIFNIAYLFSWRGQKRKCVFSNLAANWKIKNIHRDQYPNNVNYLPQPSPFSLVTLSRSQQHLSLLKFYLLTIAAPCLFVLTSPFYSSGEGRNGNVYFLIWRQIE